MRDITKSYEIVTVSVNLIFRALKLHFKYKFSFFDSLMVVAALEDNCSIFYSEDMQDGQVVENSLTIKNPFV